jgi:hypothetical protein
MQRGELGRGFYRRIRLVRPERKHFENKDPKVPL